MSNTLLERERVSEIHRLSASYNVDENISRQYIEAGRPVTDFQQYLLSRHSASPVHVQDPGNLGNRKVGLNTRELGEYSVTRALTTLASGGKLDGLEREVSDTISKRVNRAAKGFFIPSDVICRGLTAGNATAAGNLIGTDTRGDLFVEALRNSSVLDQLGAVPLSDLIGNISIPRGTGTSTAYWLAEEQEAPESAPSVGSISLVPHRVASCTSYTKQLLAQSSITIESFVRQDLLSSLALEIDRAGLNGSGTNGEPLGIFNTDNVNTVTFGGAPTFAKIVEMESVVAADNAAAKTMHYVTTPSVRGSLKTTVKASGTAAFIWDGEQQVNGYDSLASNQIPDNRVLFGDFSQLLRATWDGMDVTVDPYTQARSGKISVYVSQLVDWATRHPESFAISTDAGNQSAE